MVGQYEAGFWSILRIRGELPGILLAESPMYNTTKQVSDRCTRYRKDRQELGQECHKFRFTIRNTLWAKNHGQGADSAGLRQRSLC